MAVEYCVVSDLDLVVEVEQLLNVLVVILHVVSLADIRNDACVESFDQEL
jgi:hypothetical protein